VDDEPDGFDADVVGGGQLVPGRADREAEAVRVPAGGRGQGSVPEGEGNPGRRIERPARRRTRHGKAPEEAFLGSIEFVKQHILLEDAG